MSLGAISLQKNIRTCKVNTGWANRIQSDRFENPAIMVCPVWNQVDLAGRPVNADSFVTKTAGCNNPGDRVVVENYLRPDYSEYVNLNPMGYRAPIYDSTKGGRANDRCAAVEQFTMQHASGQFGGQRGRSTTAVTCPTNAYQVGMAQEALERRKMNAARNSYRSFRRQRNAGNAK